MYIFMLAYVYGYFLISVVKLMRRNFEEEEF